MSRGTNRILSSLLQSTTYLNSTSENGECTSCTIAIGLSYTQVFDQWVEKDAS
jgi:hypothetical protein